MKIKNTTLKFLIPLIVVLLTMPGQYVKATDYLTQYIDDISENDTLIYSLGTDSIQLIAPTFTNASMWQIVGIEDTLYVDTLILPNGYEGYVYCNNWDGFHRYFHIYPFTVDAGEDKIMTCGGAVQLDQLSMKRAGSGTLTYDWFPSTGLDDATIPHPTSTANLTTTYTVTVLSSDGYRASDSVTVINQKMDSPDICMVGVDSADHNIIVWNKPESTSIDSFYIYKETRATEVYEKISAVAYSYNSVYTDVSSNAKIQSNKYKISIVDVCGAESEMSIAHKTMHLSLNQGQDNVWNLIWEHYEGISVSTYYIYRGTTKNNLELIGSSTASNTQYSDFSAPNGHVYYQIEIVSPNCHPIEKSADVLNGTTYNYSRSNVVTNNPTGLNDYAMDAKFITLYPNPTRREFTVELDVDVHKVIDAKLFDVDGRAIKQMKITQCRTLVNVDDLHSGVYFIHFSCDNGVVIKKVLIE